MTDFPEPSPQRRPFHWFVYTMLFTFAYMVLMPYFLWRMQRRGGYWSRFADRFGILPAKVEDRLRRMHGAVWIHAVSIGEVYVAGQVMRALRDGATETAFVLSTTSSTGWTEAEKILAPQDVLIFYPFDFPFSVRRMLDLIRPQAFIFVESEIWPNMLRYCHHRGVPLFLVNGRISDRSAVGYRLLRRWFGPALCMFSASFVQSGEDKDRLLAAGADPRRIVVSGNFKFDVARRAPQKEKLVADFLARHDCGPDCIVLLGASIWPGEDTLLIRIYQRLRDRYPALRLVLVPRHFEKADAVQAEIEKAGLACVRKSRVGHVDRHESADNVTLPGKDAARHPVVLGDTTGELMDFYGNAGIVFVGKSLCEHGGQNMIEPCLCGVATLVGPHTENFRPVVADLLAAGALIQVPDAYTLEREIEALLRDAAARRSLGTRGAAAVRARRGTVGRCVDAIKAELATIQARQPNQQDHLI